VPVREHLKLDVPRSLQELLHVDLIVAEGGTGFRTRDADGVEERGFRVHHAHATSAATT